MPIFEEYLGTLRCQTWNVWPETTVVEYRPFWIDYGPPEVIPARLALICFANRTAPEKFLNEETQIGHLVWDGAIRGLHRVRGTVLKAPEDTVKVTLEYRNAQRGEVDICVNFKFEGDIPPELLEAARGTTLAVMSLLNLHLQDFLTPAAPFQLRKVLADGADSMATSMLVEVHNRQTLPRETIETALPKIAGALFKSRYGEKLRVALELYAAHFTEQQVRVRFLLLVMAMESIASPTKKHSVAVTLLGRWQEEIQFEIARHGAESEEAQSLEALARELNFRAEDSVRSQIRKLFTSLRSIDDAESNELQQRALRVYDKRSKLVHDGYLPVDEFSVLEKEARTLLEKIFTSVMNDQSASSA